VQSPKLRQESWLCQSYLFLIQSICYIFLQRAAILSGLLSVCCDQSYCQFRLLRLAPSSASVSPRGLPTFTHVATKSLTRILLFFVRRKYPSPPGVPVGLHFAAQSSSMAKRRRRERGPRQEQPNTPAAQNHQSRNLYDSLCEVENPNSESLHPGYA
jgi:hypothetical protein